MANEKYVERIKSASTGVIYTIRDQDTASKQDILISGENIKTINDQSILGSGNIQISGTGAVDSVNGKTGTVVLEAADVHAATEAQGAKADTAVQPSAISDMETQTHASSTYQAKLTSANAGTNVTITEESGVVKISAAGGSGGASTFAELQGQPTDNANLAAALNAKQDTLVSGTNIKSINSTSLLGSGNIEVLTSSDVGTMAAENKADYFTKTEVTDEFLPTNLGSENAGKYVKVGISGEVVTETVNIPDVSNYYTKTEADNEFLSSNQGSENVSKTFQINSIGDIVTTGLKTINNETIFGDGNIVIGSGGTITIDDEISATSENPVQNKVIKSALDQVVDYIPNGGITREKLSFPTRPLKGVGTQVSEDCANCVVELYLNPDIAVLAGNAYWVAKGHAGNFYCRPSSAVFNAYMGLATKENNKCYEITITTTTDAENYPVGTLVGYVVFDDIETLKTLRDTGNPDSINYNFCTNLSNNPVCAATIQASAGIPDNSITTTKLVNNAVTYEKIDFGTLRPIDSTAPDYSACVAEFYPNPSITLPVTTLDVKCYGTSCYYNCYNGSTRIFRSNCQPTENYKVYELKIDTTSDGTLYPIGAVAGYIVFDNVTEFLSKPVGTTPINVRYEFCKNLVYSPRINNYLNQEPTPDAPVTIETYNEDRNVEICLPNTLYAVVGDKIQLFHKSVLRCFNPYIYNTTVICNIGNNYPRYYELTPTLDQVGNHSLTYIVRDQNCKTISTKTINLKVVNKGVSPANNMNVLCIGASATSAGIWPSELKRRLISSTGTPQGDGLSNITFVGRMTATPDSTNQQVNYEATGGYTFGSYVSTNDYLYKFYFANEHLPDYITIGDVYSYSGTEYTITEINIPSTDLGYAGYVSGRPNGNGGSTGVSGTLTRVTGTGDLSITFDHNSRSGNPFCYDGVVDLQRYANEFCNGTIDLVYSQLVFNGAIINGTVEQIKAGNNIANMITFANYLHTAFPNAKLGVGTGYNPDGKGGCGANYGASNSTEYGYKFYVMNLARAFQEAIDENNLGDFVFVATNTPEIDSENIFPYIMAPVNTRSTVTEERGSNGVHPTAVGQCLLADSYYRDFIARFCQA